MNSLRPKSDLRRANTGKLKDNITPNYNTGFSPSELTNFKNFLEGRGDAEPQAQFRDAFSHSTSRYSAIGKNSENLLDRLSSIISEEKSKMCPSSKHTSNTASAPSSGVFPSRPKTITKIKTKSTSKNSFLYSSANFSNSKNNSKSKAKPKPTYKTDRSRDCGANLNLDSNFFVCKRPNRQLSMRKVEMGLPPLSNPGEEDISQHEFNFESGNENEFDNENESEGRYESANEEGGHKAHSSSSSYSGNCYGQFSEQSTPNIKRNIKSIATEFHPNNYGNFPIMNHNHNPLPKTVRKRPTKPASSSKSSSLIKPTNPKNTHTHPNSGNKSRLDQPIGNPKHRHLSKTTIPSPSPASLPNSVPHNSSPGKNVNINKNMNLSSNGKAFKPRPPSPSDDKVLPLENMNPNGKSDGQKRGRPPSRPFTVPDKGKSNSRQKRDVKIDTLLKNKAGTDFDAVITEYLKRQNLPNDTKLFILNSQDDFVRKVLIEMGWVENKVSSSQCFHLKWTVSDTEGDYRNLKAGQLMNHFQGNREMTSKSGLIKNLRQYSLGNTDTFFPRAYDLGDSIQLSEFQNDYLKVSLMSLVQTFASSPDLYANSDSDSTSKLLTALSFCSTLLSTQSDTCEGPAHIFIGHNGTKPIFNFNSYPNPSPFEIHSELTQDNYANYHSIAQDLSQKLTEIDPQAFMQGVNNTWIVKPGHNARGSGVHCTTSADEAIACGSKLYARIVQKYIERPLLIHRWNKRYKFDLRQWVLVTSFEPLKVYFFNSCYLRICQSEFDLNDITNPYKHLANYSIQKNSAKTPEDTVWSLSHFLTYQSFLDPYSPPSSFNWSTQVLPKLHTLIIHTLLSMTDCIEPHPVNFT